MNDLNAYQEGQKAYHQGKFSTDNPYDKTRPWARRQWSLGFMHEANKDRGEEMRKHHDANVRRHRKGE